MRVLTDRSAMAEVLIREIALSDVPAIAHLAEILLRYIAGYELHPNR